jgi:RHS repeat-associated protein
MAMSATYLTMNGMIVHENRDGVQRDYVPDTLGSTAALVDNTQTITDRWEYWPYGEVSKRTGTSSTRFTFVGLLGYVKDILDKLLYVRARHLKPDLARWQTVDPLWPDEPLYGYAQANPVSHTDPSGEQVNQWFTPIMPTPADLGLWWTDVKVCWNLLWHRNPAKPAGPRPVKKPPVGKQPPSKFPPAQKPPRRSPPRPPANPCNSGGCGQMCDAFNATPQGDFIGYCGICCQELGFSKNQEDECTRGCQGFPPKLPCDC